MLCKYQKRYYDKIHSLPENVRDTRLDRFVTKLVNNGGNINVTETKMTSSLGMLENIGVISVEKDMIFLNEKSPYLAALDGWFEEAEQKFHDPNFVKPAMAQK